MRTVILGAAGRDFHDFLVLYRDDPNVEVVAFTATQIPYIDDRRFPPSLAGPRYPQGIPIVPEDDLEELLEREGIEQAIFAYSDVSNEYVARLAARVQAAGVDFVLPGGARTMLRSSKPVLSVCAVRTGCGKSQATRYLLGLIEGLGHTVVGCRHPMPYGNLKAQTVQRFATRDDLLRHDCTIEEREEYEPYVARGRVVYAGVDYEQILRAAEKEADIVAWDGGNNDLPFFKPDLHVVLVDPLRPGDELKYYPSESQLRLADVVLIPKSRTAGPDAVAKERALVAQVNPTATVVAVASKVGLAEGDIASLAGARVVCVEDGPTTTHGGMLFGAATLLAQQAGAVIVDPRPYFAGELIGTYRKYPKLGPLVPAMGYSDQQRADLAASINAVPADYVLSGTPIDLGGIVSVDKPMWRVSYDLEEMPGEESLKGILEGWLATALG